MEKKFRFPSLFLKKLQKLDRYFFDNMEMSKIMDFPNTKKKFNELKFFSTESAIIAALIFVGLLLF